MRHATRQQIKQFHSDRKQLPYNDCKIAALLQIDKGNYSKYVNDRQPITLRFLGLFYETFQAELAEIAKGIPVSPSVWEICSRQMDMIFELKLAISRLSKRILELQDR